MQRAVWRTLLIVIVLPCLLSPTLKKVQLPNKTEMKKMNVERNEKKLQSIVRRCVELGIGWCTKVSRECFSFLKNVRYEVSFHKYHVREIKQARVSEASLSEMLRLYNEPLPRFCSSRENREEDWSGKLIFLFGDLRCALPLRQELKNKDKKVLSKMK